VRRGFWLVLALLAGMAFPGMVAAQATDGAMSEAEVESLRDAAYVPVDRIKAFQRILDDREKRIEELMGKPHHAGFALDIHDAMDQFGAIAGELNDNLDEYAAKHRDVRKALPKLVAATERWATALRAPVDDDRYKVVRRIALDSLKDVRATAEEMETSLTAYYKEHPEALKAEKERAADGHAPQ
jgi:hypothetical protein